MKKKSIFCGLPYQKDSCQCHCLDVIYIEKNVCDNVIYTLLSDSKKSKDHIKAHIDLKLIGIRPNLQPNENGKYSPTTFTLTNKGKRIVLTTLNNITVSDGYLSNILNALTWKM